MAASRMRRISPWARPLLADVPRGVARHAALRISMEEEVAGSAMSAPLTPTLSRGERGRGS